MNLNGRLSKLEDTAQQLAAEAQKEGYYDQLIWDRLIKIAGRIETDTPNEEWCETKAPIEIASMALVEIYDDRNTPELWEKVEELSKVEGAVAPLFKGLLKQKAIIESGVQDGA